MKERFIKNIGTNENLFWVYMTTPKKDMILFEGDIFWNEEEAKKYFEKLEINS